MLPLASVVRQSGSKYAPATKQAGTALVSAPFLLFPDPVVHGIVDEFCLGEQVQMLNSIGSWLCIMGLVVGPFSIGVFFEEKLQRANRELGSRLLRRY